MTQEMIVVVLVHNDGLAVTAKVPAESQKVVGSPFETTQVDFVSTHSMTFVTGIGVVFQNGEDGQGGVEYMPYWRATTGGEVAPITTMDWLAAVDYCKAAGMYAKHYSYSGLHLRMLTPHGEVLLEVPVKVLVDTESPDRNASFLLPARQALRF